MSRLSKLFSRVTQVIIPLQPLTIPKLINEESKIGGELFGKMERGVSRRFFLDEGNSWFFSETATDPTTGRQLYSFTIRYEMHDQGVLKSVDGKGHVFIEGVELQHLIHAIDLYDKRVRAALYSEPEALQTAA
jgi:hypothetical protein